MQCSGSSERLLIQQTSDQIVAVFTVCVENGTKSTDISAFFSEINKDLRWTDDTVLPCMRGTQRDEFEQVVFSKKNQNFKQIFRS